MDRTTAPHDVEGLASPGDPSPDPNASATPSGEPAVHWSLKLAVLVIVALLCLAFAGLVWALIF